VFEHLSDPTQTLHELHRILKPGGTVVLAVPQSKCLAYWLFGKYWVQLDIPRHLFTHSTATLKEYAKKTGFSVKKIRFNSGPGQFWGSFLYWKTSFKKGAICPDDKTRGNKLTFLMFLPFSLLCNLFRIGDQVEVILTKPHT
jgi:predicted SAM-dependent methyltransferase